MVGFSGVIVLVFALVAINGGNGSIPRQEAAAQGPPSKAPKSSEEYSPSEASGDQPGGLDIPDEIRYQPTSDRFADRRVTMVASRFNAAPGAIVCQQYDTVGMLFELYSEAWGERMIGGKTRDPDPEAFGCEVLGPGIRVKAYAVNGMPNVVARFDGQDIQGVTMAPMLVWPNSLPEMMAVEPGSTMFPEMHNSPDTIGCEVPKVQCTDEQFVGRVEYIRREWELAPEWLKATCSTWHTAPPFERCLMSETLRWLNGHPHDKAPWLLPDGSQKK